MQLQLQEALDAIENAVFEYIDANIAELTEAIPLATDPDEKTSLEVSLAEKHHLKRMAEAGTIIARSFFTSIERIAYSLDRMAGET